MRLSLSLLLIAASAEAFLAPVPSFVKPQLCMTSETHISGGFQADSGMTVNDIPLFIKNLSADNFDESLEMLEPLLVNECVGDQCELFMEDLKAKCKEIGKELPAGYAPSHH